MDTETQPIIPPASLSGPKPPPLGQSVPPPLPKRRRRGFRSIVGAFFENAFLLFMMIAVGYTIELIDWLTADDMLNLDSAFGIRPRESDSLMGIATAHWMHGNWEHIVSNTLPFVMLGGFVLLGGRKLYWKVTLFVALVGGALLWMMGDVLNWFVGLQGNNHIGASLVIFGYLGFLLFRGIFERSPGWIALSIITLILYGGMILGVMPGQRGVSWEGHFFGFVSGIVAAKILVPKDRNIYQEEDALPTNPAG